jgi:hypothetical protein
MRTEDDLRAALTTLEHAAPDSRQVLASLGRRTRRVPRWRVPAAAVAATTVAFAGVPLVKAISGDGAPEGAPGGRWTYSYTVVPPDGWRVYNQHIDHDSQSVNLFGPGYRQCIVTSFAKDTFGADKLVAGRRPITVNGHPGFVGSVRDVDLRVDKLLGQPSYQHPTGPAVVWEYAPSSWRLSYCLLTPGDRSRRLADSILMANAVRDVPRVLRTPYKVGYLPDGWTARTFGEPGAGSVDASQFAALLTILHPGGGVIERIPTDPMAYQHINISFTSRPGFQPTGQRVTINGLPAWLSRDAKPGTRGGHTPSTWSGVFIKGEGFWIGIEAVAADPDFTTELVRVAQHLTLAPNPLNVSTWFDGNAAIP